MTDKYCYRVQWYEPDEEYVGLCTEFPNLSHLDKSPEKALSGIRALVRDVVAELTKLKKPVPQPFVEKRFSGKFIVRVPQDVHRRVALAAEESGVSLNQYVATRLAAS